MTAIEWTERTWNPTTGCDKVSPGCYNCYALTMAKRLKAMGQPRYQNDGDPVTSGPGFGLSCHPDSLDVPSRRKKPTMWFVNSMSDLFHKDVPQSYIYRVFAEMGMCPQHTFQILTKRPQRMQRLMSQSDIAPLIADQSVTSDGYSLPHTAFRDDGLSLRNVWLGTSIESDRYTFRADHLRATPAAVRFLSLEPLLGPVPSLELDGIDWVIVGGESGSGARPMKLEWVVDVRDRCVAAGVPFFFKQWGKHDWAGIPVGKKKAGRLLDGRTWDHMPEVG